MKGKPTAVKDRRAAELASIHIRAEELGLDDGQYRDLLQAITTKRSAAQLNHQQRQMVLEHFDRLAKAKNIKTTKRTSSGLAKGAPADRAALLAKIDRQLREIGAEREYLESAQPGKQSMIRRICKVDKLEFCPPEGLHKLVAALEYHNSRKAA